MNPIKPPINQTKGFNAQFHKQDLEALRKHADEMQLDMRDLLRVGLKMVIKIKDRNKIIRILITPTQKNGLKHKSNH